ncbi:GNAT family N-acetyltransferase [Lactiplantibacillus argentoratensis]|uniref:GNAT family N-acetyltransferase n=1 Tax=Lactiplantibacillus argentoratensis TaxID=271881 RepID=UPI003F53C8B3
MSQFEKYHPILTPHYTFDWLTKVRVIDVFNLYQTSNETATMEKTAAQINHTMREIFHDHQLVWGVTDRETNAFVGQVGFAPIDMAEHEATLSVDLTATYQQVTTLKEILERLVAFGTVELKLHQLTLTLPRQDPLMAQVLRDTSFTTTDQLTFNYHQ